MRALKLGLSLVANAILTSFELPPLRRIKVSRGSNAAAVTRALRRAAPDSFTRFARTKSRSAILAAAKNHLCAITEHEELIAFLGRRRGVGANFDGFWLNRGDRRGVGFT
ncbi:MAG TPA: hypothetical protein VIV60_28515, partial [Polyangiaceae bacterium]